jgi:hypothetical protein
VWEVLLKRLVSWQRKCADGMQKVERWKNGEEKLKMGAGESP